ncbi:MAG TPA: glutamate synthase-related protein [Arthrobacter sp.]|nr:glutamate synthase-related protein [Arthrobacter sp.]
MTATTSSAFLPTTEAAAQPSATQLPSADPSAATVSGLLRDIADVGRDKARGGYSRPVFSAAGFYDDFQDGRDPAGITTQDPELASRLDPVAAGRRLANYLRVLTMEAQTIARACGKSHLHNLEPEDLVALTIEASAMARVPLAGTSWIPGAT